MLATGIFISWPYQRKTLSDLLGESIGIKYIECSEFYIPENLNVCFGGNNKLICRNLKNRCDKYLILPNTGKIIYALFDSRDAVCLIVKEKKANKLLWRTNDKDYTELYKAYNIENCSLSPNKSKIAFVCHESPVHIQDGIWKTFLVIINPISKDVIKSPMTDFIQITPPNWIDDNNLILECKEGLALYNIEITYYIFRTLVMGHCKNVLHLVDGYGENLTQIGGLTNEQ